jgi:hypothetical protein
MLRSLRWTVPYLVVGAFLLGGAAFLLERQSRNRFDRACELENEGKLVDAIEQYEWAVRAYTPFSNTPRQAIERLERIARDAEVKHDTGTAIQAWQAIVSGLAVVENVAQPYSEVLATAETRLEALRNKQKQDKDPPEG